MKRRVVEILVATFVAMTLIYGIVVVATIYPRFAEIEHAAAEQAMRRVLLAIETATDEIDVLVNDWSSWNGTYDFAAARSETDIAANLVDETFVGARLALIAYLDPDRRLVWGCGWDRDSGTTVALPDFENPESPVVRVLTEFSEIPGRITGIIDSPLGYLLVVARPVLTGTDGGPAHGTMVMGRRFDETAIGALGARLQQEIGVLDPSAAPVALPDKGEIAVRVADNGNTMNAFAGLYDLFGMPFAVLEVALPRNVTMAGRTALVVTLIAVVGLAGAVLIVVIGAIDRLVTRPLSRLSETILELIDSSGHLEDLPVARRDELGVVARAVREMHHAILEIAHRDSLTGLPNRMSFYERADHMLSAAQRRGSRVALLLIELEGFRAVNDAHGHQAGDMLLRDIARRLSVTVRESDVVARLGGDEFVVLGEGFPGGTEELARMGHKILEAFEQAIDIGGARVRIGGSVGASLYPDDAPDLDRLLGCADRAMHAARRRGGSCFVRFGPECADVPVGNGSAEPRW